MDGRIDQPTDGRTDGRTLALMNRVATKNTVTDDGLVEEPMENMPKM